MGSFEYDLSEELSNSGSAVLCKLLEDQREHGLDLEVATGGAQDCVKAYNEKEKKKNGLNLVLVYWYQRTKRRKGTFLYACSRCICCAPFLVLKTIDGV